MEYKIFTILVPFSVGVLLVTGLILFIRYKTTVAKILLMYFIVVIIYLMLNMMELLCMTEEGTTAFARAEHIAFALLPVIWLRFSICFSGNRTLKKIRNYLPFIIVPVLMIILFYTNQRHCLMWRSLEFTKIHGYLTIRAKYGMGMWVYGIYNDFIYLLGIALILHSTAGAMRLFKRQALLIIIGILLPMIFNAVYALHLFPFLRKDFTPLSYTITSVLCYIGISRLKLFKIQPVSRSHIFQNMNTGFVVLDAEHQMIDYNSRAAELFCLNESMLGRPLNNADRLFCYLSGSDFSLDKVEHNGVSIKGRYYNIYKRKLNEKSDSYEGYMITVTDITREIELINEKTELSERLIAANTDLKNAQEIIIQQEKLSTIGQLTAGIAHEINNPLSFVNSNFKIFNHYWNRIKEEDYFGHGYNKDILEIQHRIEEVMKDSEDGINRVIEIVQDLLKFSRPVKSTDKSRYNLNKGIETSLIMMGNQIKYTSEIIKEFGDIEEADCRENEINQVIINLLSNAVHAIKSRKIKDKDFKPRITIKTWSDKNSIFCSISNNGIPIPVRDIPNLFQPFFTTKKSNEGTGLGLAISKDIIEGQYNGRIDVECAEETTFIFSIPIKNTNRQKDADTGNYRKNDAAKASMADEDSW